MSETVKWGFGMAPLKSETVKRNRNALRQVRKFVLGEPLSADCIITDEISITKGLFNRVLKQNQWDWFTVNMYLDYPSYSDIKKIVIALSNLRKAILERNNKVGMQSLKQLELSHFIIYCDNYINYDNHLDSSIEYLYILSRREEKDVLKIGMTTRNVKKRVDEINSATGVLYPYAARKVYKVKDCHKVEKDIHTLLSDYRIRKDREFFRIEFGKACSIIEDYLKKSHQEYYDNEDRKV